MKLLLCLQCDDVVALRTERLRKCFCGASSGRYLKDGLHATYSGPALLIGFANSTLSHAIKAQLVNVDSDLDPMDVCGPYANERKGREFKAFIIPESASSTSRKELTPPALEQVMAMRSAASTQKEAKNLAQTKTARKRRESTPLNDKNSTTSLPADDGR